jgi:predicted nucleotidyltransferase
MPSTSRQQSILAVEARAAIDARYRQRRQHDLDLYEKAAADAAAIIDWIASHHASRRIYQWGSLLRPESFRSYSDIDIALEGVLDPAGFFAILGQAEKMTRFPVDIVQLEKIEPEFAESIRETGKLVYERT